MTGEEGIIVWEDFVGGKITFDGGNHWQWVVGYNEAAKQLTTKTVEILFYASDDDQYPTGQSTLGPTSQIAVTFTNAYHDAYIEPRLLAAQDRVLDGGFQANLPGVYGNSATPLPNESVWVGERSESFWVAYLSWIFQGDRLYDNDPMGEGTVVQGNWVGSLLGGTSNGVSVVATESVRDEWDRFAAANTQLGYTGPYQAIWAHAAHEVGHQFVGSSHVLQGLLIEGWPRGQPASVGLYFDSAVLAAIRARRASPGE